MPEVESTTEYGEERAGEDTVFMFIGDEGECVEIHCDKDSSGMISPETETGIDLTVHGKN